MVTNKILREKKYYYDIKFEFPAVNRILHSRSQTIWVVRSRSNDPHHLTT